MTGQRQQRASSRGGFTLLEILVALAIIAILSSMIFPVFTLVRENGRRTACLGNLHQLGLALTQYAHDHNSLLPPYNNNLDYCIVNRDVPPPSPSVMLPERGKELVTVLTPYTKSTDIWFCPSDPDARTTSTTGFLRHQFSSYRTFRGGIFRRGMSGLGWPFSIEGTPFASASQIPMLSDESWTILRVGVDHEGKMTPHSYSHNESFNFLYRDGHVKSLPLERNFLRSSGYPDCASLSPPPRLLP